MCAAVPRQETLVAHIFVGGEHNLDSEAAFSVAQESIAEFALHPSSKDPDGRKMAGASPKPNCDFALKRNGEAKAKGSAFPSAHQRRGQDREEGYQYQREAHYHHKGQGTGEDGLNAHLRIGQRRLHGEN